jgi:hypothetical protein
MKSLSSRMTAKTLKELRDSAPFKPFDIYLADGQVLPVVTLDHLFFMPGTNEFMLVLPDGGFRIVDIQQVVSAGRNGTKAKR